ncbi:hypothetical protein D3C83_17890 [compost metagenome]
MDTSNRAPISRWVIVGWLLTFVASFAGLAHLITLAIDKVLSGQGLETYRTFWLVEFNYVGVLVLFGAVILALLVGTALQIHERWLIRDLEKKYGGRASDN